LDQFGFACDCGKMPGRHRLVGITRVRRAQFGEKGGDLAVVGCL
jgi:hypothetical protein